MTTLTSSALCAHAGPVATQSATGCQNPNFTKAHKRPTALFSCSRFMAGVRARFGVAGFLCDRFLTPHVRRLAASETAAAVSHHKGNRTMKTTTTAAPAAKSVRSTNPHCEFQFPHNMGWSHFVAGLREAINAASIVANLLQANDRIITDIENDDEPDELPRPYEPVVTEGLRFALNVCHNEISRIADRLTEFDIIHREVTP
ncbi:MAG: hypothetical protein QM741_18625 [Rudaea sp.]|uniref:hypothetical protein n=1 Tax=Rudaea sp. TaxID=2136325 RepID=UPI0039E72849